jgi:outer membrane protein assembly factor BamB
MTVPAGGGGEPGVSVPAPSWNPPEGLSWPIFRGDRGFRGVSDDLLTLPLSLIWEYECGDSIRSSPVIREGKVYVGSDDGFLHAVDLSSGKKAWAYDTGSAVESPPLVVGDGVFVGNENGAFFALNAASGEERWVFETEGKIVGSANWIEIRGREAPCILVGSHDNIMRCFGAATGELIWRFPTQSYINGAPALHEGRIVFGGCDARVYVVDGTTGKEANSVDAGSYIAGSVAVEGDRAYVGHYENELLCIDLVGGEVVWRFAGHDEGPFFSSPAVSGNRVVTGCRDGRIYCVKRKDGAKEWEFSTEGDVDSSPVIGGDKVVAPSTDGTVYVLNLRDGALLWSFPVGAAITGSPAVGGGMILVGAEDGKLYAFGPKDIVK